MKILMQPSRAVSHRTTAAAVVKPSRRLKKAVKILLAAISAVMLSALLQSCATSPPPLTAGGKVRKSESIVCPQCKMVAVATSPSFQSPLFFPSARGGFHPGWSSFGWGGLSFPQTSYEDKCPGCQGAITTFAREGKLKHKCSICSQKPFKCPVFHPGA
jgi:hypothetical protein